MNATPLTLELLKDAARTHPLLLHLIANPPTYEHTIELPNAGHHTREAAA